MSEVAIERPHLQHEELSFWRKYIFAADHKMSSSFSAFFMVVLGGLMALFMRWQLAWPETFLA